MGSTQGHFPYPGPNPMGNEMKDEAERDLDEKVARAQRTADPARHHVPWWRRWRKPRS